jgi:hypothetical protein
MHPMLKSLAKNIISGVDSGLNVGRNRRFEQDTYRIQSTTFYPAVPNYIKDTCAGGGGDGSSNKW